MEKITQTKIASFIGVSDSYLSELKSGTKGLSKQKAKSLSERTGIPFEKLALTTGEALYRLLVFAYSQDGEE